MNRRDFMKALSVLPVVGTLPARKKESLPPPPPLYPPSGGVVRLRFSGFSDERVDVVARHIEPKEPPPTGKWKEIAPHETWMNLYPDGCTPSGPTVIVPSYAGGVRVELVFSGVGGDRRYWQFGPVLPGSELLVVKGAIWSV